MTEDNSPALGNAVELGLCSMFSDPGIIERIGKDWDWVWIDCQHGTYSGMEKVLSVVRACNLVGVKAFVRVPSLDTGWISLALDTDADGLIIPQVDTVEQARAAVRAAKFPPLGNRSFGGRRPIDLKGRGYYHSANRDRRLLCQIESPEGLSQAEAIAAVEGVDGLFLGPDDMILRQGHSMDQPRDMAKMTKALETMCAACHRHGKLACMVAVDAEMMEICLRLGVQMIVAGADAVLLAGGSGTASAAARKAVDDSRRRASSEAQASGSGGTSSY